MTPELKTALSNFKRCAEEAPPGTYGRAKQLDAIIGGALEHFMRQLREAGYVADCCDHAFALEAAMYEYTKRSNPRATVFFVSEGFGASMDGPERERVIEQAKDEVDLIAEFGKREWDGNIP